MWSKVGFASWDLEPTFFRKWGRGGQGPGASPGVWGPQPPPPGPLRRLSAQGGKGELCAALKPSRCQKNSLITGHGLVPGHVSRRKAMYAGCSAAAAMAHADEGSAVSAHIPPISISVASRVQASGPFGQALAAYIPQLEHCEKTTSQLSAVGLWVVVSCTVSCTLIACGL